MKPPKKHMGGCQNYGPFWAPIVIGHLVFKGDHNFDNHPHAFFPGVTEEPGTWLLPQVGPLGLTLGP